MKGGLKRFVMPARTIRKLNTATFWPCMCMGFPSEWLREAHKHNKERNKEQKLSQGDEKTNIMLCVFFILIRS